MEIPSTAQPVDIPLAPGDRQITQASRANVQPGPAVEPTGVSPSTGPIINVLYKGLTGLYTPAAGVNVVADLIFVHGLMGHPYKTWQGQSDEQVKRIGISKIVKKMKDHVRKSDKTSKPTCYWPLELVPKDFTNVRILTYGYDSHPTHFYGAKATQMTITQHAQLLINRVVQSRAACPERPLIFVAHSLGGILVKDAIIQSLEMEHQPIKKALGLSCKHIVFFGTPHLGAGIAQWGEFVRRTIETLPGGKLLQGLSPDSEKLDEITRRFNALLDRPEVPVKDKIHICSFQEGQGLTK